MGFDIYTFTAAALCVSHLVLAAAAIILCVLLFWRTHSFGWLLLAVSFVEPLYRVVVRMVRGMPPLWYWYWSDKKSQNDLPTMMINFDFPTLLIFAVVGLFILYRREKQKGH